MADTANVRARRRVNPFWVVLAATACGIALCAGLLGRGVHRVRESAGMMNDL